MKKAVLILAAVLVTVTSISAQIDLRPKLPYLYSIRDNGYPMTANADWVSDTLALRALCDSNGYKGSCLPLIVSYVSDYASPRDPSGVWRYRINEIYFKNLSWLKKITSNMSTLIYLKYITIGSCTNLIYMTGISQYVENITISNTALSTFNFDFKYLKRVGIYNCKNLKTFSYKLNNSKGLWLNNCGIEDLTGIFIGDSLKNTTIFLDSNNLSTLPLSFLQKLVTNKDSISVKNNNLLCAGADVAAILDKIAVGNWRATQKPCTTGIKNNPRNINIVKNIPNKFRVDLKGRLIKKECHRFSIIKNSVIF
jgi:hypothetical protein